jgi:hypothetical protein
MGKEQKQMLTARQFADALEKPYPTVMGWLQNGKVPGAQLVETPIGSYYEIPADILEGFEPPKRGRPGKAAPETKPAKKRASNKAGN